MSASVLSKLTLALLAGTFAFAQDLVPTEPKVISRVEPNFPNAPAQPVRLQVFVDWKGQAKRIVVLRPHDLEADEAAIAAAQRWRFQPGTRNGVPVDSTLVISFPTN